VAEDVAGADVVLGGKTVGIFAMSDGIEISERFTIFDQGKAAVGIDLRAAVSVFAGDSILEGVVAAGDVKPVAAGVGDFDADERPPTAGNFDADGM